MACPWHGARFDVRTEKSFVDEPMKTSSGTTWV